jgi:osmotically-inducible protein OsmY
MKTDAQLQEDVIAELQWEPAVDATQIGVEVKDGIVTLAGHVTNYAGEWNAEHAAQRVYGVKALVVEIDVTLAGTTRRTDGDIADSALKRRATRDSNSIKVSVEDGEVTLSRSFHNWTERELANDSAWGAPGVRNVVDLMTIGN